MQIGKRILAVTLLASLSFFVGCSSAPSKRLLNASYLKGEPPTGETVKSLEDKLTLGANQATAGYSVEVMLYTEPLVSLQAIERGRMNKDSEEKIKREVASQNQALTKNQTCFLFNVHTYTLERAQFKYWIAKVQDSSNKMREITFNDTISIPRSGSDMAGRRWHGTSIGCTKDKVDISKSLTMFVIPQLKNNRDQDETTTLNWDIAP